MMTASKKMELTCILALVKEGGGWGGGVVMAYEMGKATHHLA